MGRTPARGVELAWPRGLDADRDAASEEMAAPPGRALRLGAVFRLFTSGRRQG